MAIKNRITVGLKQLLEVDANPMLSATPAPIGSQAMWMDGTVGKAYLKIGALDTDWASFQTGVDTAGWNFASSLAGLNDSAEDRYLGTKSGDFNIHFVRNNVDIFQVTSEGIAFSLPTGILSGFTVQVSASNVLYLTSSTRIEQTSKKFTRDIKSASDGSPVVIETKQSEKIITSGATQAISIASARPNKHRMAVLKMQIYNNDGFVANFVKTYSLKADGNIEGHQDDYTMKASGHSDVRAVGAYDNLTHVWTFTVSNLSGIDNRIVLSLEEESHEYVY